MISSWRARSTAWPIGRVRLQPEFRRDLSAMLMAWSRPGGSQETFHSVHVEAAERVAVQAHRVGVERLAHVSGLGADAASPSPYIRKRGEGELAVKAAFTDVILFRPAVMFGPDDAFLTTILELLRRLSIYPMFGRGRTRLQPAYVEDVAEAIARALQRTQTHAITFECGGPRVYSYEELLRALARDADLKRILIPLPFAAWRALAWTAELLPNPPVTRNQVELMQIDNVCSPGVPGFAELGISPHSVERVLQLPQRLGLDLPNALARQRELLADHCQRVFGVHADAEAHAQHALLAWR